MDSKNILLLNPPHERLVIRGNYCSNESKANYYIPALDLVMQSAIVSQKYNVHLIDSVVEELSEEVTIAKIKEISPFAIIFVTGGISEDRDESFLRKLKKEMPDTLFIGSGDILLFDYKTYINKWEFLDAILMDHTTLDILDYLEGPEDELDCVAFKRNGKIFHPKIPDKKGKIYGDLKNQKHMRIGIPRHDLFTKLNYRIPHGMYKKFALTLITYGCPYMCDFCPQQRVLFKYRDIDEVLEEMEYIQSLGIKEIEFFDQTFAARRDDTVRFCEEMIKRNIKIKWICMSRVDVTDDELLTLMKRAGCHTIQYGVESGSDVILKKSHKGVTTDKYYHVFQKCKELGIKTLGHFIVGLPGETDETVKATVDYAIKLDCDYASFNIAEAPLGTKLRGELIQTRLYLIFLVSKVQNPE
jgi:anaerobic magnesium-protoporphyrin IX monomethyl ester cyclase